MAIRFDYLVLGSGIAGLSFALKVADSGSVAIVTKAEPDEGNTKYAQGGIAAVVDPGDSAESHIQDTLVAGAGLCEREAVEVVVHEGPARVQELVQMGAQFTRENGQLHLGREGGHSANRIVHAADATGREVESTLLEAVARHSNITMFTHHFALELITEHHLGQHVSRLRDDMNCFGAYVLDTRADNVETMLASATLLATGGSGHVYLHSTNPDVATGDGIAMAYRAKAKIENMEFVQFHPTSLYYPEANSFLITEAVRGEGGILLNKSGRRFMPDYDDRAELAPRDIVARAIDDQLKKSGDPYVLLDISHVNKDHVISHFPNIHKVCKDYGIDMTREPIPVVPAAHYQCGGVRTDLYGKTSINGLYACGEVACTGLHGANRLASNSLLEGLVFAERAAQAAKKSAPSAVIPDGIPEWDYSGTEAPHEWVLVSHNQEELRRIMWNYVGIVRSGLRLDRARRRTRLLYEETEDFYRRSRVSRGLCELRNMIAVAYLIIKSAGMRRESRGLHYMLDYPEPSNQELRATVV